ncbi:hypothetical protein [Jannaschia seohaensis]|uniref:Ca2+-binding RTX toxin-like protein n=1 Tax=Jannaschia seohaensis TaxID=475081 RepID=A0A2Y9A6J0_9RHOB|nr:hypothetical protein [Jannaschia seohaensis]PWJ21941.1 Ca2+-binding RTX toxin-like protein [Jannaschia seohaensis]SSA38219.1 Ca2+-binding protein, RTX toxin-related [Jannaschia seohaensis]
MRDQHDHHDRATSPVVAHGTLEGQDVAPYTFGDVEIVTDYTAILAYQDFDAKRWNAEYPLGTPVVVTYRFPDGDDLPPPSELHFGAREPRPFTRSEREAFHKAADAFGAVAGITLVEIDGPAMIEAFDVGTLDFGFSGYSGYPYATREDFGSANLVMAEQGQWVEGSSAYLTLLHELGHALGLSHPHEGVKVLTNWLDGLDHTVMTYNNFAPSLPTRPQHLDVEALRHIYGPPQDTEDWTFAYDRRTETLGIAGGAGDDVILTRGFGGKAGGRGGNDGLVGSVTNDTLSGGPGNDTLYGVAGWDRLQGDEGDDRLVGSDGWDTLFGGPGNDTLDGSGGWDHLWGDDGNDRIFGANGGATVFGGAGNDTISGYDWGAVFRGEDGRDLLLGDDGRDDLDGGAGDDTLLGGSNFDTLQGGDGNDNLNGGPGVDSIRGGADDDTLDAGLLTASESDEGNDDDWADVEQGEVLIGDAGDDLILGRHYPDILVGGPGDDTVRGDLGNDLLRGKAGIDALLGEAGDDTLEGGEDADRLKGGAGSDVLHGEAGDDTLEGGTGGDALTGGAGSDDLRGGGGRDWLDGGAAEDTLIGGDGRDTLLGGAGDDILSGGAGPDTLAGGQGNDRLIGGEGVDMFVFVGGHDSLADWTDGEIVRLDMSALGLSELHLGRIARGATRAEDGAITFQVSDDSSLTLLAPPARLVDLADDLVLL